MHSISYNYRLVHKDGGIFLTEETKLFIASISDPDLSDFGDTPAQAKKNVLTMLYLYFEKDAQQEAIVNTYEQERATGKIVAGGGLDDLVLILFAIHLKAC